MRKNGFTFVELLIASLVFSLALAGLLQSVFGTLYFKETTADTSTAVFHLGNLMERMRATAFNSLTARFTNNTVDGPSINRYPQIVGGYTLRNERITVSYTDAHADPLEIKATVRWDDSRGRPHNLTMATFRTR